MSIDTTYRAVAVSGGKDSIVLLHMLMQQYDMMDVIHIDHAQHPASAMIALELKEYVERLGLHCHVYRLPSVVIGASETVLRDKRYEAFAMLMPQDGILYMGHHWDDNVETVLLAMMRSSSIRSICGIPKERKYQHFTIKRPMLDMTRHKIDDYHQAHHLPFWQDPSNDNTMINRNFLRHDIIPKLTEHFPHASQSILSFTEQLKSLVHWVDDAITERVDLYTTGHWISHALHEYDVAQQHDIIAAWCYRLGYRISLARLEVIRRHLLCTQAHDIVEGLHVITAYSWTMLYEGDMDTTLLCEEKVDALGRFQHIFGLFESRIACIIIPACHMDGSYNVPDAVRSGFKKRAQTAKIPLWLRRYWPVIQTQGSYVWWTPESPDIVLIEPSVLGQCVLTWFKIIARSV